MNVVIRDAEALGELLPEQLSGYLRATRWLLIRRQADVFDVWETSTEKGAKRRALVPLDREFGDYAERVSELLQAIADVEGRSHLEVYDDVYQVGLDRVSFRVVHPSTADGSIPLPEGVGLFENVDDMMLAAAVAADHEARRVELTPASQSRSLAVQEYLRKLRLGQTARGSYIVNILSPLRVSTDDATAASQQVLPFSSAPAPGFGRRSVRALVKGLEAVRSVCAAAAEKHHTSHDVRDLLAEKASEGVTARLLSAVVGMAGFDLKQPRLAAALDVGVRWSPFGLTDEPPARVTFDPSMYEHIALAGESLKSTRTEEAVEVFGHVIELKRTSDKFGDWIAIDTKVEGKVRRVRIELFGRDYQFAIDALKRRLPLSCVGKVARSGNTFVLEFPREVHIVEPEGVDEPPQRVLELKSDPDPE